MEKFIQISLLGALFVSCEPVNKFFGLPDDNMIEELAEEALKYETGLDVDLTPTSPEIK